MATLNSVKFKDLNTSTSLENIIEDFKKGINNKIEYSYQDKNSNQVNILSNIINSNRLKKEELIEKILNIDYVNSAIKLENINAKRNEVEKLDYQIHSNIIDILQPLLLTINKEYYFKINSVETKIEDIINIIKLSSDIIFENYTNNPIIENLTKSKDKINNILKEILPDKNSYYQTSISPTEFKNIQDKTKINTVTKKLASYKIGNEINQIYEIENNSSEDIIYETIKKIKQKYDIRIEDEIICEELLNVFQKKDIIRNNIAKLYEKLTTKESTNIEQILNEDEIKIQIKNQLKKELDEKFKRTQINTDNLLKKEIITTMKQYLSNIIQKDEFTKYVIEKTKILPAMESFENSSINHILENSMNSKISRNILDKFYMIYDNLERNLEQKSFDEFYDYLNRFEFLINQKSKGLSKIVSGLSKKINLQTLHYKTKYEKFNEDNLNNLPEKNEYVKHRELKEIENEQLEKQYNENFNLNYLREQLNKSKQKIKQESIKEQKNLTTKILEVKASNQTKGVKNKLGLPYGIEYGTINDIIREFRTSFVIENKRYLNENQKENEELFENLFNTLFEKVEPIYYNEQNIIKENLEYIKNEISKNIEDPAKTKINLEKVLNFYSNNPLNSYTKVTENEEKIIHYEKEENHSEKIKEVEPKNTTKNLELEIKTQKPSYQIAKKKYEKTKNEYTSNLENRFSQIQKEKEYLQTYKKILLEEKFGFLDDNQIQRKKLELKRACGYKQYENLEKTTFLESA